MTEHLLTYRTDWQLYIKEEGVSKASQRQDVRRAAFGELHPICQQNEKGVSKSRELLAHMLAEAPKIVEEARSEARLHEVKKQKA